MIEIEFIKDEEFFYQIKIIVTMHTIYHIIRVYSSV